MKIYLGETGLNKNWQKPFPKIVRCPDCGGEARIVFVGIEEDEPKGKYICDLRDNGGVGDYWFYDACAIAIYLCKECFKITGLENQA